MLEGMCLNCVCSVHESDGEVATCVCDMDIKSRRWMANLLTWDPSFEVKFIFSKIELIF